MRESFFYPKYLKHVFHYAIPYKITCASLSRQQWCILFRHNYSVPLPPLDVVLLHHLNILHQKIYFSEFKKILNLQRNGTAPGINMISYKVYKLYPSILDYLLCLFKSCFKICVILVQRRIATEVYSKIRQSRPKQHQ